jgi:phosphate transport system permease protein
MTTTMEDAAAQTDRDVPIFLHVSETPADRVFRGAQAGAAGLVLFLLVAVTVFLAWKGWPALHESGFHFLTDTEWNPDAHHFGVAPLLLGSIAIAVVAVLFAAPVSLATALVINEYAPPWLRSWLISIVDVLATIPSIVYGFWGLMVLSSLQQGTAQWIVHYFGFIPFARIPQPSNPQYNESIFAAGLVCALTLVPIITSVSREVMSQAPRDACEAALGLGGTKWGMITDVILPFSRDGIVGGILLGFGRGLGETMIVVLVLSPANHVTAAIMGPNGLGAIAKEITENFSAGSPIEKSALILAGLALFATTLAVNAIARTIVLRSGRRP